MKTYLGERDNTTCERCLNPIAPGDQVTVTYEGQVTVHAETELILDDEASGFRLEHKECPKT